MNFRNFSREIFYAFILLFALFIILSRLKDNNKIEINIRNPFGNSVINKISRNSFITYDCIDWTKEVDLSRHPVGEPNPKQRRKFDLNDKVIIKF